MWNVRFVLITFIFLFNQASYAKEIAGQVVSVAGIAFIRPDKNEGLPSSPPKAKPGDDVFVGDVINTSSEGAVKILMRDKTIVDIGASSLFKVDEYIHNHGGNRKAKLDLVFGKVRVAVTKKIENGGAFTVKSKGATMGVRGTEFIVKGEQGALNKADKAAMGNMPAPKTEVIVTQGKVDVTTAAAPPVVKPDGTTAAAPAPKTISLTENMAMVATSTPNTGGGAVASAPVKLSETQMKTEMANAKMADNTFVAAVTIAAPAPSSEGGGRSPASDNKEGKKGDGGQQAANGPPAGPMLALPPLPPVTGPIAAGPIDVPGGRRDPFNNAPTNFQGFKKLHVTISFAQ